MAQVKPRSLLMWLFCVSLSLVLAAELDEESTADLEDDLTEPVVEDDLTEVEYDDGKTIRFTNGFTANREDDMILSDDQEKWLFGADEDEHEEVNSSNITKRAGTQIAKHVLLWPRARVPYVIQPNHFDKFEHQQIKDAMSVWEDLSCLKFVPRTQMDPQWLHLQHTNDGCWSLLGMAMRVHRGGQPISLQKPGCRDFGTYLHEIGHAIGLVHEHQLPTRNMHVRYHQTNVDPQQVNQLQMYNRKVVQTFNTPYDLGSIMHYDIMSFSVDDVSPTLGIDNPWLAIHIGRRNSHMLSFGDARTINYLYQCSAQCSRSDAKRCPQQGYLDKNCECITPQIFHQKYCRNSPDLDDFCYSLVPKGLCDIENLEHHKHCSKACGFCPRFLPGESAIGAMQMKSAMTCLDRYHEPQRCKMWSSYCSKSTWMHRYCRRTCGACSSRVGDCPNFDEDKTCDKYAKQGLCHKETNMKRFVQSRCQDSCNTCNYQREDRSCRNNLPDEQCKKLAIRNGCEKNPIEMFQKCPSTCNRCYWNKGNCKNRLGNKTCLMMALQNHCTNGSGPESIKTKKGCGKTCNSCALAGM